MVKVVFTDGSFALFENAEAFSHDKDHKLFSVICGKNQIMLPDHHVVLVGIWDDENKEYI